MTDSSKQNRTPRATGSELTVLMAYFGQRQPEPLAELIGMAADDVEEYKTTDDICDELRPILDIDKAAVADFMLKVGYTLAPYADGSVRWKIYRARPKTE